MKLLILLFCLLSFNSFAAITSKQANFCDTGLIHVLLNDEPNQEFYVELSKTNYRYIWFHTVNDVNTALMIYWDNSINLNDVQIFLKSQKFISSVQCLDPSQFRKRQ